MTSFTAVANADRVHQCPLFSGAGTLVQAAHFDACTGMSRYTVLDYYLGLRKICKFPGKSLQTQHSLHVAIVDI